MLAFSFWFIIRRITNNRVLKLVIQINNLGLQLLGSSFGINDRETRHIIMFCWTSATSFILLVWTSNNEFLKKIIQVSQSWVLYWAHWYLWLPYPISSTPATLQTWCWNITVPSKLMRQGHSENIDLYIAIYNINVCFVYGISQGTVFHHIHLLQISCVCLLAFWAVLMSPWLGS